MTRKCETIGIDIDGTLSYHTFMLKKVSEYYKKPLMTIEDIKDYNITSFYGISAEESMDFWINVEASICEGSELNHAVAERIYDEFVDWDTYIYIITSRNEKYREITEEWLKKHDIPYHELIMTGGISKVELLRDLEIDVMVDDKPHLFHEVAEEGLETKMICVDYNYNKGIPCDMRINQEGKITYVRKD